MTYERDEILAAYRQRRGPDPAAVARIRQRLDRTEAPVSGSSPDSSRRWLAAAAGAMLAAAAAVLWWRSAGTLLEDASQKVVDPMAVDRVQPDPASSWAPATVPGSGSLRGVPAPVPPSAILRPKPTDAAVESLRLGAGETVSTPSERPPADPVAAEASLAEETAAVAAARLALNGGDFAEALRLIERYHRDFPRPRLREEADAVATMARCRRGDADPDAASRFRNRYPRSLFGDTVHSACRKTDRG